MKYKIIFLLLMALIISIFLLAGCGTKEKVNSDVKTIKVGFFPNITHAQALVGLADGTFQKHLGNKVKIKTHVFNAGPTAVEAMLAGGLDLAYMGPVPAMNGAWKSNGNMQIIAGSCEGGAILVVRKGAKIKSFGDLRGKKVAIPQLANTQDLTFRRLLTINGLKSLDRGGDVTVLPVENPDILALFQRGNLDAALVPEPWGSRLVREANGQILLDWQQVWEGGRYPTAVVVVSKAFMAQHQDLVEKWLKGHLEVTDKLSTQKVSCKALINQQLEVLTGKPLPSELLENALSKVYFTARLEDQPLQEFLRAAKENGYGKEIPDLNRLINKSMINRLTTNEELPK